MYVQQPYSIARPTTVAEASRYAVMVSALRNTTYIGIEMSSKLDQQKCWGCRSTTSARLITIVEQSLTGPKNVSDHWLCSNCIMFYIDHIVRGTCTSRDLDASKLVRFEKNGILSAMGLSPFIVHENTSDDKFTCLTCCERASDRLIYLNNNTMSATICAI